MKYYVIMWHLMEIMSQHCIHSSVMVQAGAVWGIFLIILILTFSGTAMDAQILLCPWNAIWQKLSVLLEIMFKCSCHRCQLVIFRGKSVNPWGQPASRHVASQSPQKNTLLEILKIMWCCWWLHEVKLKRLTTVYSGEFKTSLKIFLLF